MTNQESSHLKWFKVWYKFKGDDDTQLSFDFTDDNDGWVGPFHFDGQDSETLLQILYNEYDSKNNLIYKITGTFKNGS